MTIALFTVAGFTLVSGILFFGTCHPCRPRELWPGAIPPGRVALPIHAGDAFAVTQLGPLAGDERAENRLSSV